MHDHRSTQHSHSAWLCSNETLRQRCFCIMAYAWVNVCMNQMHVRRTKEMLVMTPAILYNLIKDSIISFSAISLLIFDEAHHCTGSHPYADIMRKYHEVPATEAKPKIFGMTASPVNTKAGSDEKMRQSIQTLQQMMDARLKTVGDVAKVQARHFPRHLDYMPSPET
jgi:superfamily II DNA/RNA helicase